MSWKETQWKCACAVLSGTILPTNQFFVIILPTNQFFVILETLNASNSGPAVASHMYDNILIYS